MAPKPSHTKNAHCVEAAQLAAQLMACTLNSGPPPPTVPGDSKPPVATAGDSDLDSDSETLSSEDELDDKSDKQPDDAMSISSSDGSSVVDEDELIESEVTSDPDDDEVLGDEHSDHEVVEDEAFTAGKTLDPTMDDGGGAEVDDSPIYESGKKARSKMTCEEIAARNRTRVKNMLGYKKNKRRVLVLESVLTLDADYLPDDRT